MAQARRHNRDGDSSIELGSHEVAEVVEPEMTKPGSAAHPDKALGHEVRRPRPGARLVGTENEAILGGGDSPIS